MAGWKIIILLEGSAFLFNGLFAKNSKIIHLGDYTKELNKNIYTKMTYYYNNIIKNNDVIIVPYQNGNFDNSYFLYNEISNLL